MTPYVVYEGEDNEGRPTPQKPKSIMVGAANGYSNGNVNGTVNGAVNGSVNGGVNGNVNGSVNGGVNGGINGSVKQHVNGSAVHLMSKDEDVVETPDSLPSRSSVSGRSIIGNGKNGKSGALKR
ncbi:uncharacterized protein TNIN_335581 [Trichonephila inaurata madagascariensis]|uniref:Uncharacterized protein n=1 Tax=Trichonephila inaurata madagascariensis TaxID=2747483 RepID=A0A8X6WSA8_9ARAC|nr:uncharacterized protein TNIN_335581 [Trichonephila inaurata madagascariensis]